MLLYSDVPLGSVRSFSPREFAVIEPLPLCAPVYLACTLFRNELPSTWPLKSLPDAAPWLTPVGIIVGSYWVVPDEVPPWAGHFFAMDWWQPKQRLFLPVPAARAPIPPLVGAVVGNVDAAIIVAFTGPTAAL